MDRPQPVSAETGEPAASRTALQERIEHSTGVDRGPEHTKAMDDLRAQYSDDQRRGEFMDHYFSDTDESRAMRSDYQPGQAGVRVRGTDTRIDSVTRTPAGEHGSPGHIMATVEDGSIRQPLDPGTGAHTSFAPPDRAAEAAIKKTADASVLERSRSVREDLPSKVRNQ